jgi:Tol biopolymer transport system component
MRVTGRRRGLFVALAVTLAGVVALPAGAKVSGTNGQIAFSRFDPNFQDDATYTMNPDGSNPQPLFPAFASNSPHWSPSGTEVAVVSPLGSPCPPTCMVNTVIINPDTHASRVLAQPDFPAVGVSCSLWSPDASHFACDGENDNDASVNGVYTIRSSDGLGLTRITNAGGGVDVPIDYSPGGTQIVYGHFGPFHTCDGQSALYIVNADGSGSPRRITPFGFCDEDGSWSPNGKWIAFEQSGVTRNGGRTFAHGGNLFVVQPDGTGLRQITLAIHSRAFAGDVSWSPDGKKITFNLFSPTGAPVAGPSSFSNYQEGIATANADGSDVVQLTSAPISETCCDHQADWGTHPIVTP